jgi:hypothetical protein
MKKEKNFPKDLKLFLLLLSTLMLMTCGGGQGRPAPSPPLELTVGSSLPDTIARSTFNAYVATVSPGDLYKISISNQTDDADLLVYGSDSSYTTLANCSIDNTSIIGTSPEDCVIIAPSGTLYFGVDGTFISAGAATYTVDIELLTVTNLILSTPLADSTTQKKAAVYAVTVPPGVPTTVGITGLSDDVDLHVFGSDNTFSTHAACSPDNTRFTGTTPEDCTLTTSGTSLYFIVDGIFSSTATIQYTALATPTPVIPSPVSEGTISSPIAIQVNASTTGQVSYGGTSYYAVGGLTQGAHYTISILALSANATLKVFTENTFTTMANCLIDNTSFLGTIPESCTLVAPGTTLYFTVAANTTSAGVAFLNLVEPGP